MNSWYWAGLGVTVVAIASCNDEALRCGRGTERKGNECVIQAEPGHSAGGKSGGGNSGGDAGSAGDGADIGAGGDLIGEGGDTGNGGNGGNGGGGGSGPDLITTALDCDSRNVTGATVVTKAITEDTVWSGVIHLPNGLSVDKAAKLTITPGTRIIVGPDALIEFGSSDEHATIVAEGTVAEPIRFCGETDTAGYWAGMVVRSGLSSESVLKNVLIADGGGTDAALTLQMPLLVKGVQVRNSGTNGVNTVGFAPESSTLIVSGAAKAALTATAVMGAEVPVDSQLTGNGLDLIDLAFPSFNANVTLGDRGVPYRQLADLSASTEAVPPVVTFEPGVTYSIAKDKKLDFGNAAVHALGSGAAPIVFQGLNCAQQDPPCTPASAQDPADSGGRVLASGNDVRLEYVDFRKLGSAAEGALTVAGKAATLAVDHVNITGATGYGLTLLGTARFSASSTNLNVALAQGTAPLQLGCAAVTSLPAETKLSTALSNGTSTVVNCPVIITNDTWSSAGSPYSLSGVSIYDGAGLTLAPGTTLRVAPSYSIYVFAGGTLNAVGSAGSSIQFNARDASNWGGISAEPGSTVHLDYAVIDHAGASANAAAIAAKAPVSLTNSTISNSATWGLKKDHADATDYSSGNTFVGNVSGDVTNL